MQLGLTSLNAKCTGKIQAIAVCALVAHCALSQPAFADRLTWREGLKEGGRRLERWELALAQGCFRQALRDVKKDKNSRPDDVALCLQRLAQVLQH